MFSFCWKRFKEVLIQLHGLSSKLFSCCSTFYFNNLSSKVGRSEKRGLMGAVSTHGITNDDICHHHHIATKAYCLLQIHLGSKLGEFLNTFSRRVIGRQKIRQTPIRVSRWTGRDSYQFLINCNKLRVLSWFLCQPRCWCACRPENH